MHRPRKRCVHYCLRSGGLIVVVGGDGGGVAFAFAFTFVSFFFPPFLFFFSFFVWP